MSSSFPFKRMFKGDDEDPEAYFQWELEDGTFDDMNFTGVAIIFSLKYRESDPTALIEKKNAAAGGDSTQIEMTDPSNGKFVIKIQPADTEDLDAGKYVYDIEATFAVEGRKTLIKELNFILVEDVTKH